MKKRLLCVLCSVVLFVVPWMGWTSLTLFVAFVPLLMLQKEITGQKNRRGKQRRLWPYLALTFALWWLICTYWVGYSVIIGIVAAVVIGTLLNTGAFMIYHAVWRRAPRALAYTLFVAIWIGYEYFYTRGELSFPWLTLGHGFAWDIRLVQWYEVTGVFGGSLWVLICNLMVFSALKRRREWRRWIAPGVAVLAPMLVSLAIYRTYREPGQRVKVTVLQPDLDPWNEKFAVGREEINGLLSELMTGYAPHDVDFIVGPETALADGDYPSAETPALSESVRDFRALLARSFPDATLVLGAVTYRYYPSEAEASASARKARNGQWVDMFNSALSIDSSGRAEVHHKTILVVGAEKTPYYSLLKHLDFLAIDLGGISGQMGYSDVRTVFGSRDKVKVRHSAAICYESVYGGLYADFVRRGAQVMFIITNDGWWRDTPGYRQHFEYARLRAVETRRSIARSANTGISGFINQRGDVLGTLDWDVRGGLTGEIALNDRLTFYVRHSDLIGRISWLLSGLCLLGFCAYRMRRKLHVEPALGQRKR